jgi:hypothetical protein
MDILMSNALILYVLVYEDFTRVKKSGFFCHSGYVFIV